MLTEVTESSVNLLLSFGEATVKIKRSPEKLFVLLDMYAAMCNLLPERDSLPPSRCSSTVVCPVIRSRYAWSSVQERHDGILLSYIDLLARVSAHLAVVASISLTFGLILLLDCPADGVQYFFSSIDGVLWSCRALMQRDRHPLSTVGVMLSNPETLYRGFPPSRSRPECSPPIWTKINGVHISYEPQDFKRLLALPNFGQEMIYLRVDIARKQMKAWI
eukprot:Gb_28798 [translate_table: standard]